MKRDWIEIGLVVALLLCTMGQVMLVTWSLFS